MNSNQILLVTWLFFQQILDILIDSHNHVVQWPLMGDQLRQAVAFLVVRHYAL